MIKKKCMICDRIKLIEKGTNRCFIKNARMGYIVAHDFQYYPGYVLLIYEFHAEHLHEIPVSNAVTFLNEMVTIGHKLYKALHPLRINYGILGNTHSHLHAHIIPRYKWEDNPTQPIWNNPKEIRESMKTDGVIVKKLQEILK